MTREEAIADIKQCLEDNKWGCGKYTEAFCWAMYALNEDCVIEDIKAEIAEEICLTDNPYTKQTEYTISHKKVLEIIDKHIADVRGKE